MTEVTQEHVFAPLVVLTEQADGRYRVNLHWEDSYLHTVVPELNLEFVGDGGLDAYEALDNWLKTVKQDFVISATSDDN